MDQQLLKQELQYKATTSSGAGGQHVNKVASKVEVRWNAFTSSALTEEESQRLKDTLSNRLSNTGELVLQCGQTRSQHKNKELVTRRMLSLVSDAIKKTTPRKKTRVPKAVKLKRLREKKIQAEKKAQRRDPLK